MLYDYGCPSEYREPLTEYDNPWEPLQWEKRSLEFLPLTRSIDPAVADRRKADAQALATIRAIRRQWGVDEDWETAICRQYDDEMDIPF